MVEERLKNISSVCNANTNTNTKIVLAQARRSIASSIMPWSRVWVSFRWNAFSVCVCWGVMRWALYCAWMCSTTRFEKSSATVNEFVIEKGHVHRKNFGKVKELSQLCIAVDHDETFTTICWLFSELVSTLQFGLIFNLVNQSRPHLPHHTCIFGAMYRHCYEIASSIKSALLKRMAFYCAVISCKSLGLALLLPLCMHNGCVFLQLKSWSIHIGRVA